jgi:hypothetical protein
MATAPSIYHDAFGTTAFTKHNHIVMNGGSPCVAWSFQVRELEDWLTTLEEIMPQHPAHRSILEGLYFSLKAAHVKHEEQHDEIVTEAPSADDLMQYLAAYAAAIGGQPELSPTVTTTEATNV